MGPPQPAQSPASRALWDRFLAVLRSRRVKVQYHRWCVIRAEHFLKASGKEPHAHTANDVASYLSEIGRNARLEDWQYQQVVTALEILPVHVLQLPWTATFD